MPLTREQGCEQKGVFYPTPFCELGIKIAKTCFAIFCEPIKRRKKGCGFFTPFNLTRGTNGIHWKRGKFIEIKIMESLNGTVGNPRQ